MTSRSSAQSGADAGNTGARPAAQYTYSPFRGSTFNPNEFTTSYPEVRRGGGMLSGELKPFRADNVKAYLDLSWQRVNVDYALAPTPTGDFETTGQGLARHPRTHRQPRAHRARSRELLAALRAARLPGARRHVPRPRHALRQRHAQRLAPAGASNPFNPFNQDLSGETRGRLVEFGNRLVRSRHDAALGAAGLKGENIAGKWNFDASFSFSSIREVTRNRHTSASRFNQVVNAASPIFDPRSPGYIGTTTPYNPFGYYRNPIAGNAALADYANVDSSDENTSTLAQLSAVGSTRELLRLPGGPVGLAFGTDFRREQLAQRPSALALAGDILCASPSAVTRAQRKIAGLFVELRVPIFASPRGGALRAARDFFHQRRGGDRAQGQPPLAADRRQLTLRASYSEGFREPSLFERYSSPISALSPIIDPRGLSSRSSASRSAATAASRPRRRIISTPASSGRPRGPASRA